MSKIDPYTLENVSVTIALYPDTDSSPDDADCYEQDDIDAWKRDEWRYVGVVLTIEAGLGGTLASVTIEGSGLWGVEWYLTSASESERYVRELAHDQYDEIRQAMPSLPSDFEMDDARIVEKGW